MKEYTVTLRFQAPSLKKKDAEELLAMLCGDVSEGNLGASLPIGRLMETDPKNIVVAYFDGK